MVFQISQSIGYIREEHTNHGVLWARIRENVNQSFECLKHTIKRAA